MVESLDTRLIAPTICKVFGLRRPAENEVSPLDDLAHDLAGSPSIMVVVFDGFGARAMEMISGACPNLMYIRDLHFQLISAVPPPKTPVNFASMATGASQSGHRIEEKTDPLTVETLFHVLSESDLSTCVAGRESGSPANLFRGFAEHLAIAKSNTDVEVLRLVLDIVRRKKPAFTLIQFLDIDNAGHRSGPFSDESFEAVDGTDRKLGTLMKAMAGIKGALVVLTDHGQHEVSVKEGGEWVTRGRHDGTSRDDYSVPLAWCSPEELSCISALPIRTFHFSQ